MADLFTVMTDVNRWLRIKVVRFNLCCEPIKRNSIYDVSQLKEILGLRGHLITNFPQSMRLLIIIDMLHQ